MFENESISKNSKEDFRSIFIWPPNTNALVKIFLKIGDSGVKIWGSGVRIKGFGAMFGGPGARIGGSGAKIRGSGAKFWGTVAKIEVSGIKNRPLRPGLGALRPISEYLGPQLVALGS